MRSPPSPWARRWVAFVLLGSAACGDRELQWVGDSNGGGTTTTGAPDPVEPASDATAGGDSTTGPPSVFLGHPDFGGEHECSVLVQDCPAGMKCMMYASQGGTWDSFGCFPIEPDPDAIGEPCTVVDRGTSGLDSCEVGAMCWDVDPETLEGECVAYCTGSWAELYCEDPADLCASGRFPICLPTCCPVEQDCPEGQACYPVGQDFTCSPNAAPDAVYGDGCEFLNVCPPGTFCANPEIGLDCEDGAAGCCMPFCTLGSDDCAEYNPAYECVPWYDGAATPPGYEQTGHCVAPED